jgi:valyl-tRNA synthetase
VSSTTGAGNDIPLSDEKLDSARNFMNKLWNIGRFIQSQSAELEEGSAEHALLANSGTVEDWSLHDFTVLDRYIISRCHQVVAETSACIDAFDFGTAGRLVHDFLWNEFADWYVESSKHYLRSDDARERQRTSFVLRYVWDKGLRLLHPFMPFVTETMWQQLPHYDADSIMVSKWPTTTSAASAAAAGAATGTVTTRAGRAGAVDKEAVASFGAMRALVHQIRNARAEYDVPPGKKIPAVVRVPAALRAHLEREKAVFSSFARVSAQELTFLDVGQQPGADTGPFVHLVCPGAGCSDVEAFLPQAGLIDTEKELKRLDKLAKKLENDIAGLQRRLEGKGFADKAPAALVLKTQNDLVILQEQLTTVEADVESLR